MLFLVRIKPKYLFLIWLISVFQPLFFIDSKLWIVSFTICILIFYSWLFTICKFLYPQDTFTTEIKLYWILLAISTILFGSNIEVINTFEIERTNPLLKLTTGLIANIALYKINVKVAKTIKKLETGKELKTIDLITDILSLYFFMYTIWWLQPRVRKLIIKY